jgi:hypothetical protein
VRSLVRSLPGGEGLQGAQYDAYVDLVRARCVEEFGVAAVESAEEANGAFDDDVVYFLGGLDFWPYDELVKIDALCKVAA